MTMDFQSAMETFAEAWVAANTKGAPLVEGGTQVTPNAPITIALRQRGSCCFLTPHAASRHFELIQFTRSYACCIKSN